MDESDERTPVEVEVAAGAGGERARRRNRLVTGVAAAMLVAGSGGLGFGLGRSLSDSDDAPPADAPVAAATTTAPAETLPPAPTVAVTSAAPTTGTVPDDTGGSVSAAEVVPGAPYPGAEAFDLVWEGTSTAGDRLRLQIGPEFEMGDPEGPGGWQPAAFCFGSAQMRLTIDGPDVVDVAIGSWFTEMYGDAEVAFVGDVGVADGRPMRAVVVQATDTVAEVRATWSDGVTLAAPVERGAAVLVGETGGAWGETLTVTIVFADGTTQVIEGGYVDRDDDPAWRAACYPPPPALPAPGEQPADPAGARTAIEERFALLWDQSIDRADKPPLLDDDTGVDAAAEAVRAGGLADTARTAVFTIEELVFTAPDRAWFRYSIDTDVTYFGDRYGVARLSDGGWIFPRALMCQDLALAGGMCDPPFQQIVPPSWYEVNGSLCTYDETGMAEECTGYDASAIASW